MVFVGILSGPKRKCLFEIGGNAKYGSMILSIVVIFLRSDDFVNHCFENFWQL
jgi:hypothetical protein